jgi:hypothetical protein
VKNLHFDLSPCEKSIRTCSVLKSNVPAPRLMNEVSQSLEVGYDRHERPAEYNFTQVLCHI